MDRFRYTFLALELALLLFAAQPLAAISNAVPAEGPTAAAIAGPAAAAGRSAHVATSDAVAPSRARRRAAREPKVHDTTKGFDIASLALGLGGVVMLFLASVAPFTAAIALVAFPLAIVFATIALKRIKRGAVGRRGLAIAGLVLGIVGTALMILLTAIVVAFFANGF